MTFILPAWEDAKQEKQDEQSQEYNIQCHNGTFPNQIFEIEELSNVKGLKSHSIHDFKQKKTFHIKKQSLSFQNMLSKLWATYEMNFWERKIYGALECNLTSLT